MIVLGPIIFGFLLGLVVGSRIRNDAEVNIGLTSGAIVLLFIVSIIIALKLGNFPYYNDFPVATGFISAFIGLVIGKLIFGRSKNTN